MTRSSIVRSSSRSASSSASIRASRHALLGAVLFAAVVTVPAAAQTDAPQPRRWDILVSSGTIIPTGDLRATIKRANLTAAQLSYAPSRAFAINATVGWARSRDLALDGDPKLDLFTYDVGGELRGGRAALGAGVAVSPFAGLGVGVRSYDYRGRPGDATHTSAAYASAGGEVGKGRVRVRIEVRDYLTAFKPLDGTGGSDLRNDVAILAGIRLTRRPS